MTQDCFEIFAYVIITTRRITQTTAIVVQHIDRLNFYSPYFYYITFAESFAPNSQTLPAYIKRYKCNGISLTNFVVIHNSDTNDKDV